jgi:cell division protein FtsL
VGRDLARARLFAPGRSRQLPLALLAILLAALALAALRIDIIRMRYRMTEAIHERTDLLEEHRELTAHVRSLRDPSRLARLARDRDLAWPEQVIEIEAGELQP